MKSCISILIAAGCLLFFPFSIFAQSASELNRRGVQYGKEKLYDKAVGEFDKSIQFYNKTSAKVLHNKGWVLELKGKHREAINNYEEAIRRNPGQLVSHERVGYMYYLTGKYEEAVSTGEYVLSVDPDNRNVPKWLPDAYAKRLRMRQQKLIAEEQQKKQEIAREEPEKKKETKKKKKHRVFYATVDGMVRYGYYYKGSGFKYESTEGYVADIPHSLYINYSPIPSFEFDLLVGNPYLGALSPNLVSYSERFQAIYHLGSYYLGVGALVNHYNDDFNYGESTTLHDIKGGIVFGVDRDRYSMRFLFYPRELPHDGPQSSGKTYDVDYIEYTFNYYVDRYLSYYVFLSVNDYYFFDHEAEVSNYWGVYNIGFGITVAKYDSATNQKLVSVTFGFVYRMYLRDLNNPRPYKFFNGQGWMGANSETWFEGEPFPGFRTTGHEFSIRVDEMIAKNVFLYQKLMFELVNGDEEDDHHDLNLLLGAGVQF
ncbi:MAG TPA: tetratricopeptide repeat protein [Spirochaetota bacterium]|nr:tetratricopeptide repeat protein [Spirochaetota bacterium]